MEDSYLKINFDAVNDSQHHRSTSGVIVINAKGEVLVSKSQLHIGVGSTFAVEAFTYLKAVLSKVGMGLAEAIVEGDSKFVITKCKAVAFLVTLIGEWRWGGQGNQTEASLLEKKSREKKGPKLNNQTFFLEIWNRQTEIIMMVEWVPMQ
ncbi:hypothetical protein Gogos_001925 [Gossypium gossypioides]|uniref:RNase H type-1 domain-containing protein n=1 Tax=Gossypium gossypioides TaxID=34282 RepID=A0A7J9CQE4_GOSGO|nr:hypothetical protein [Gossypium gossypioides]